MPDNIYLLKSNLGVYQDSVISRTLIIIEVLSQNIKDGLPWELLYVDDLAEQYRGYI